MNTPSQLHEAALLLDEAGHRCHDIEQFSPGQFTLAQAYEIQRASIQDRKSTRLNSSHIQKSRMPSSA